MPPVMLRGLPWFGLMTMRSSGCRACAEPGPHLYRYRASLGRVGAMTKGVLQPLGGGWLKSHDI